jgi:hypothetical protein
MNRTTHSFTRLAALATTALALLLVTAGQAAALRLAPGNGGTGSVHEGPTPAPAQPIMDASVSALQWTLFAVVVLCALVIGAVLMNLAQRHRGAPPVTEGEAAARSSA